MATWINILPSECYLNILKWAIEYKSEFHSECFRHLRDGNTITCGVEWKDLCSVKVCYQGAINKYQAVNLALQCSFFDGRILSSKISRKKSEIGKNALCSSICSSMTTRALKLLWKATWLKNIFSFIQIPGHGMSQTQAGCSHSISTTCTVLTKNHWDLFALENIYVYFFLKKIEILMTSDISTTENAENGGLGHIPYFIIHERLPRKFILYVYVAHYRGLCKWHERDY